METLTLPRAKSPLGARISASDRREHPELFALFDRWRALKPKVDAADAAHLEAEKQLVNPPPPEGLCRRNGDAKTFGSFNQKVGAPCGQDDVDHIRHWLCNTARPHPDDPEWVLCARARAAEILEADREWADAKRAAAEACGLPAAAKRARVLHKRLGLLFRAIVAERARTEAGVMAKLAVAAPYFIDDEIDEDETANADDVLFSAARDYAALSAARASV